MAKFLIVAFGNKKKKRENRQGIKTKSRTGRNPIHKMCGDNQANNQAGNLKTDSQQLSH